MSNSNKVKKKAVTLLQRHLKLREKATRLFRASGDALDAALVIGVPRNEPIELRDKRVIFVKDQFEAKNSAFAGKVFSRFTVEDYKVPRKTPAPTTTAAATAESEVPA